jgi:serine protease inhibitor
MFSRRDTLRILGAAGLAAPVLTACAEHDSAPPGPADGALRLVNADVARSAGDPGSISGVVSAMDAFTSDLWGRLGAPTDNLALSPYSIAVALAMTANGAAGRTASQMREVLHISSLSTYNGGIDALTQAIEALAGPVKLADGKTDEIALATANQLFGDGQTAWGKAFLTVLAKEYGAGMRTVDFRHAAEAARELVNEWAAHQTHDRIPDILPPGSVDATTRLVLVNALYLKAPWQTPFDRSSTATAHFRRGDGSTVSVDMMHSDADGGAEWLAGGHFEAARLRYAGGSLAMTVALPDRGQESATLTELLGRLTDPGEDGLELSMPRWTFRTPTDLVPPLTDLGMTDAFTDRADFGPMAPSEVLSVSGVLHDAFIAVDENGTEAAAATAAVVGATSLPVARHTLVLDRPFLFVLHDTAHGTPLFVGRVADPS